MNKEITAEDIIKAIDEMFDEKKFRENETFWRGYNHGIMRVQQYIVKLNQELQRKDNVIKELVMIAYNSDITVSEFEFIFKKALNKEYKELVPIEEQIGLDKMNELEERK